MPDALFADRFRPTDQELLGPQWDRYAYVNGRFLRGAEAAISVYDRGLAYAEGVFDGVFLFDGKMFKLDQHLDRFYRSAESLRFTMPVTKAEMKQVVLETARVNKLRDGTVKYMVTRGTAVRPGLGLKMKPRLSLIAMAFSQLPVPEHATTLMTSTIRRRPREVLDPRIKALDYVSNQFARAEAERLGFDEAILLDMQGRVAEAADANIFIVRGGQLLTPPTDYCMEGITRQTVLELAPGLGLTVKETAFTPYDMMQAEEVFLTSSVYLGIIEVAVVDGHRIGDGKIGPVPKKVKDAFLAYRRTHHLTPVYE